MKIGDWVRRRGGRWHLVESVVAEDAVTRCGRRMDPYLGYVDKRRELQVSEVMPLTRMIGQPQNCRMCDRPVTVESVPAADDVRYVAVADSGDDDGSTHDESEPA